MGAPRLEVDLDAIGHNASTLVARLNVRGIAVTGVTKATLGCPEIAAVLIRAGVQGLGDSRIENLERLRHAGVTAPTTLIRSPMMSQARRIVASADTSCNTEVDVLSALSAAATSAGRVHGIVLMVELGDLREGILPSDLDDVVLHTLELPNLVLRGIGTNLACQSGVEPDDENMAELSDLAASIEVKFGISVASVSGGNSANLEWALGAADTGRINDLRLGESILLGREPLRRTPIDGLRTDAFTLVGEVIESKVKPSMPRGNIGQSAFGQFEFGVPAPSIDRGARRRAIVGLGHQDTDPSGLVAAPGAAILGASSDHLILEPGAASLRVGDETRFGVNYSALVRSMTSPFVEKVLEGGH